MLQILAGELETSIREVRHQEGELEITRKRIPDGWQSVRDTLYEAERNLVRAQELMKLARNKMMP